MPIYGESAYAPNLVRNGSMRGHIDGWVARSADTTIAYAAGTSRGAGGSISVTKASGDAILDYRPNGNKWIELGTETVLDFVAFGQSTNTASAVRLTYSFTNDFGWSTLDSLATTSVVLAGDTWRTPIVRDIPRPEGATHVSLELRVLAMDGTAVFIDDVFMGQSNARSDWSAAAMSFAGNRIQNGDFEGGSHAPFDVWDSETITLDTVTPITGTASMKVETPGSDVGEGTITFIPIVVVPGEDLVFSMDARGTATIEVTILYQYNGGGDDVLWSGTITGTATTYTGDPVTVPAGQHLADISILTTGTEEATFTIDNLSLVPA